MPELPPPGGPRPVGPPPAEVLETMDESPRALWGYPMALTIRVDGVLLDASSALEMNVDRGILRVNVTRALELIRDVEATLPPRS